MACVALDSETYARLVQSDGDGDCEHDWVLRPGSFVSPDCQNVQVYDCDFCPAIRIDRAERQYPVTARERAGALGR